MVYLIAAIDEENGIGKDGKIPWILRKDMKFFSDTTKKSSYGKKNAVIMGKVTWESIPEKYKPLPDRINVVISKSLNPIEHVLVFSNILESINFLKNSKTIDNIFIIGGQKIYEDTINLAKKIFITRIYKSFNCDRFFPKIYDSKFYEFFASEIQEENNIFFKYIIYNKIKLN